MPFSLSGRCNYAIKNAIFRSLVLSRVKNVKLNKYLDFSDRNLILSFLLFFLLFIVTRTFTAWYFHRKLVCKLCSFMLHLKTFALKTNRKFMNKWYPGRYLDVLELLMIQYFRKLCNSNSLNSVADKF